MFAQCVNFELLLEGIDNSITSSNSNTSIPTKCHDFLEKYCCQPISSECTNNICNDCPDTSSLLEQITDIEMISFLTWKKAGKYYKKESVCTAGTDAVSDFKNNISNLKHHYYNKRVQSAKYKHMIDNLEEGEILVHVDYSENYNNKQQDEIKSAYYGHEQFTIYTVCVYSTERDIVSNKTKVVVNNLAFVTPDNVHSCEVTFVLNKTILLNMKSLKTFTKVIFWSDGCSAQFRSQFAFQLLTQFDKELSIEWHFFEANHGKGAVDGIGGTVKHAVFRKVLAKQVLINSPKQFAEYADSIIKGISVIYISDIDISFKDNCRSQAQPVSGTLKVHMVKRKVTANSVELSFYHTSNDTTPFCIKNYIID